MHLAMVLLTLVQAAAAPPAAAQAPKPQAPTETPQKAPQVALDIVQGKKPLGTITIELEQVKAPISTRNFLEYVRAGHYDGVVFHRVIPNFMIQGGNMTPELEGRPTRPAIQNEANNGLRNARGTVAMARTNDPNSATDQFFINLRDNHRLDYGISGAGYAVFGRVVDGMPVVDAIANTSTTTRGPHENVPEVSVIIRRAREVKAPVAKPAAKPQG